MKFLSILLVLTTLAGCDGYENSKYKPYVFTDQTGAVWLACVSVATNTWGYRRSYLHRQSDNASPPACQ